MRVDADRRGEPDAMPMPRQVGRRARRIEIPTRDDDRLDAGRARPCEDIGQVAGEGRVGQMRMRIDQGIEARRRSVAFQTFFPARLAA